MARAPGPSPTGLGLLALTLGRFFPERQHLAQLVSIDIGPPVASADIARKFAFPHQPLNGRTGDTELFGCGVECRMHGSDTYGHDADDERLRFL